MWINLAHLIYECIRDFSKDANEEKSEEQLEKQLEKILFEVQRAKQKTDFLIKINTVLLSLILTCNILIIAFN